MQFSMKLQNWLFSSPLAVTILVENRSLEELEREAAEREAAQAEREAEEALKRARQLRNRAQQLGNTGFSSE